MAAFLFTSLRVGVRRSVFRPSRFGRRYYTVNNRTNEVGRSQSDTEHAEKVKENEQMVMRMGRTLFNIRYYGSFTVETSVLQKYADVYIARRRDESQHIISEIKSSLKDLENRENIIIPDPKIPRNTTYLHLYIDKMNKIIKDNTSLQTDIEDACNDLSQMLEKIRTDVHGGADFETLYKYYDKKVHRGADFKTLCEYHDKKGDGSSLVLLLVGFSVSYCGLLCFLHWLY